ncbi:dual specificity phosphatase DSP8 [Olea europaea subsp. europaea]|uniref:Dual specificity phosphatase DSP8 n=1 Tax=Olea europaea subsp. europaea TaxID=158383 RepID=A0A8S0ST67_OLEEU|nr:dual specificity phosphatase DSP8 [Olea europaea subsp. europaea]
MQGRPTSVKDERTKAGPSPVGEVESVLYSMQQLVSYSQRLMFVLLGAVPFPSDVHRLKELGVSGVVTLNESYGTLVPSSLYKNMSSRRVDAVTKK